MSIINVKKCPICDKELPKEIIEDNHDTIYVTCNTCGKYAMSAEFYEDYVETGKIKDKVAAFLLAHKSDSVAPFLTNQACCMPNGYKCYPYLTIQ